MERDNRIMEQLKPRVLENCLNLNTAFKWFHEDAIDDFFPDPFWFGDITTNPTNYLDQRKYRLWQLDTLPPLKEFVPKRSGLLRTAIWLHPTHRALYTATLHYFLWKIDPKFSRSLYSFRPTNHDKPDDYPFTQRVDKWRVFENNFRDTALSNSKAIVFTDLASYYNHINCESLIMKMKNLLGAGITDQDQAVLVLLERLLNLWSNINGSGIPQNMDASSFLGNLYLHNVDEEMSQEFRYFRYLDDIRIVANSEREALTALHHLQRTLEHEHLFLASDKTRIIKTDTKEFEELMDVKDDVRLSETEEIVKAGDCEEIRNILNELFERLDIHAGPEGDERKFRAYANRLLQAGDYSELAGNVHSRLSELVLPRLKTHPEKSDYWTKILAIHPTEKVVDTLVDFLIKEPSVFDWQRFYLWRLATIMPFVPPRNLLDKAHGVVEGNGSELVSSQAALFIGKHGTNSQRERLFRHFSTRRSYVVQRSILIALQELPTREHLYKQASKITMDHEELVKYLLELEQPKYGEGKRTQQNCKQRAIQFDTVLKQGVGLVEGEKVEFRLTFDDVAYEA